MITILKMIIWIVGTIVVANFALRYFGYEVNMNYFNESKAKCRQKLDECGKNLIRQGTDNAKCDFQCVDPKIIIKKQ